MDRATYEQYTQLVCARRMEEAAERFYADDIEVIENNVTYHDKKGIIALRRFTHDCMTEGIEVLDFFHSEQNNTIAAEVIYTWEALKDLNKDEFVAAGYPEAWQPLKKGDVGRFHCVFRYILDEASKFKKIRVFITTP
ncbi:hypothetical protein A1O3_09332 [Capronia epimyces CBS 606.96]|uniref:SnoaL-like domain-containing protein n=1 Tax=Capronia epimyces CBS 606.96 TaxID=1182542 RepID=W9XMG6_9EURO|nr:uncharacterized protein A1O3_09332 [Capronia epimyces CBS 606.96]EXJ78171.1 hypothetical protein A1O3_09332 [Capronia epimyces CBS 606.96]